MLYEYIQSIINNPMLSSFRRFTMQYLSACAFNIRSIYYSVYL